jgi:hypothetical protein
MASDCAVCCSSSKQHVKCVSCDFSSCRKCATKYLLEFSAQTKCMSCNKPYTRKNLVDMFGAHFVNNRMKERRQDILFELERSLLPASQERAFTVAKIEQLGKLRREKHDICMQLMAQTHNITERRGSDEYYNVRKSIMMEFHSINEDINTIDDRVGILNGRVHRFFDRHNNGNAVTVKCPYENCRGFVECKTGTCGMCERKICKNCHEICEIGHECKPDVVESIKLIMSDTRNCPSCKALIHKIEGCDQMFCTMCQTPFSWRTGEAVRGGRIHNPHYYEYLMRTGGGVAREIEDIPCGGLPQWRAIQLIATQKNLKIDPILPIIHMLLTHIEYIEMPRYRVNDVEANIDLRVLYLNNKISLEDFKREIYKREKALEKKREIQTLLATFITVGVDIFSVGDYTDAVERFECFRVISNRASIDISKVYGCVVPIINPEWEYKTMKM